MHTIPDLGIPEVKPAIELYRGELRQKMSPRFTHARLQGRLNALLDAWAEGRGRVGSEWRFYFIERDGKPNSSLVSDIAFLSYDRLPYEATDEAERPMIAPDIAIEIRSPDDRDADVAEKIELYRAYRTPWVIVVDPRSQSIDVYDLARDLPQHFSGNDVAPIVLDFRIDLQALFAPPAPPKG